MNSKQATLTLALFLMGLSAGFFFTYEASVTLGLAEVDDVTYVETFQAINATIRNVWFGIVFFGSVPAAAFALGAHRNESLAKKRSYRGSSRSLHRMRGPNNGWQRPTKR